MTFQLLFIKELINLRRRLFLAVALAVCLLSTVRASESSSNRVEIRFRGGTEIFAPHGAITMEILPRISRDESARPMTLNVSLNRVTDQGGGVGRRFFSDPPKKEPVFEQDLMFPAEDGSMPFSFPAPSQDGVYEVVVSLCQKGDGSAGSLWTLSNNPLNRRSGKVIAEAACQCVVVNPNPIPRPTGPWLASVDKELLETVDSNSPAWRKHWPQISGLPKVVHSKPPKKPETSKFPGFRDRPNTSTPPPIIVPESTLGHLSAPAAKLVELWMAQGNSPYDSGHLKQAQPSTAHLAFSTLPASGSEDIDSWAAFPLPVRDPGKPHLLEIDYPIGDTQSLGIEVVELLNPDGPAHPVMTAESALNATGEIVEETPKPDRCATHRLLFWPKTKQPMLLLSNRKMHADARFGKMRLYRITGKSPTALSHEDLRLPRLFADKSQRLTACYAHKAPFSSEANWSSLYEGSEHLLDTLLRGGYDGMMLNAVSEETVLYPSPALRSGGNDALELLFRLFDRDGLTLIPAIDFNRPLPRLEEQKDMEPTALPAELRGKRYDLLDPAVQEAMLETVRELVQRYERHPSFGGVAIQLTPEGYAQLPDPMRGLDDRTIRQFQQETGLTLPEEITTTSSPQRFTDRVRYFQTQGTVAETWIRWRTQKVRDFYAKLAQTATSTHSNARLYLAGGTMLDHPDIRQFCRPTLSRRPSVVHALRMLGFDPSALADIPSLVFLRPGRVADSDDALLESCYADFDSIELGHLFIHDNMNPGSLFFHETAGRAVVVPAGLQNRRRFVRQLAQSDVSMFFDGGDRLPIGEEESLHEFLAAFRQLPPGTFQTFSRKDKTAEAKGGNPIETSLQPLTVRYTRDESGLIVYLVNDAPFGIRAGLLFSGNTTGKPENPFPLSELGGSRKIEPPIGQAPHFAWQVSLEPYDFLAVRLDDPAAALLEVEVARPESICGPEGLLKQKINQFGRQIQAARSGVAWNKLDNPGCELPGDNAPESPGWYRFGPDSFSMEFDTDSKISGRSSLKMTGSVAGEAGSVFSNPFPSPETGRLFVSAVIGIPEHSTSLPLQTVLFGQHGGAPFVRTSNVETVLLPLLSKSTPVGGIRWQRMVVPFDQLPTRGLQDLRVGFEWTGAGTFWVDDVTLYQVAFTREESNELYKLVSAADIRLSTHRISDLLAILEGHWSQFLFRHVPEPSPVMVDNPAPPSVPAKADEAYASQAASPSEPPPKKEPPGLFDRVKSWFVR